MVSPGFCGIPPRRLLTNPSGTPHYQKALKNLSPPFSTLGVVGIVFVAMALKSHSIASNPGQLITLILPLLVLYGFNFVLSTLVGKFFFNRGDAIALAIAMTAFGKEGSEIALIIALAYIIQVQAAAWYVKFTDRLFGPAPDTQEKNVQHVTK